MNRLLCVAGLIAAAAGAVITKEDLPIVDLGYERHQATSYNVSSSPSPSKTIPTSPCLRLRRSLPRAGTSATSATPKPPSAPAASAPPSHRKAGTQSSRLAETAASAPRPRRSGRSWATSFLRLSCRARRSHSTGRRRTRMRRASSMLRDILRRWLVVMGRSRRTASSWMSPCPQRCMIGEGRRGRQERLSSSGMNRSPIISFVRG